jgi:hypothetical protein
MRSLRNGADCLQEVVEREVTTKEQAKAARDAEKKAQARQRELVRLTSISNPTFPLSLFN